MDLLPLVEANLGSLAWFRPELALTAGALLLLVLDLAWRRSPGRVARRSPRRKPART